MRRLRSPWAILALVPVFFLAGFGVVSALARGSEAREPTAAQAPTTPPGSTSTSAPQTTDGSTAVADETTTEGATTSEQTTTGRAPATTGGDEALDDDGGSSAPPPGTVAIDYGRWRGVFRIAGAKMVRSFGASTVTGEFRYHGGAGCPVKRVRVDGRFYDLEGLPVGRALWETSWATGAARIEPGARLLLEAYGMVMGRAVSARMSIAAVVCA